MRLNWMIPPGMTISQNDIHSGAAEFFNKHNVVADTIRMCHKDYSQYLASNYTPIQVLEKGKQYGLFVAIPGGMAELVLLEEDGEVIANNLGHSMIVFESTHVDREFEKHVLSEGK